MTFETIHRRRDEVNLGFRTADQYYLRKWDNYEANPPIQILSYSEPEEDEEEPEQTNNVRHCPECESYDLKQFLNLDIWFCHSCSYKEDNTTTTTKPIEETNNMYIPYAFRGPYATSDPNDTNEPFLSTINVNKDMDQYDNPNIESVRELEGGRIKHIRIRGSPVEALSAMNDMDGKQQ